MGYYLNPNMGKYWFLVQHLILPVYDICRPQTADCSLNVGSKPRNIVFDTFSGNVPKQVARFCCPCYRRLTLNIYMILHGRLFGRLEVWNFSSSVKNIPRVSAANEWNVFELEKRNFLSPRGHVMMFYICINHINMKYQTISLNVPIA